MARPSYGPEAKKRAKRLLEVLLMYANDELGESNEAALDALRPQVQIRWQTEKRLVVRTKVRFLAALTTLESREPSCDRSTDTNHSSGGRPAYGAFAPRFAIRTGLTSDQ